MKTRLMMAALLCMPLQMMAGTFRIMSYNIRHGANASNVVDLASTASVIRRVNARFVALQEVDVGTSRLKGMDEAAELSRLTGLYATFAKAISFGGGEYGNALLSREKPLSVRKVPLPGVAEKRVLLLCEFADCWVGSMHLAVDSAAAREQSVALVRDAVKACGGTKPVFVCGDWNAHPDSTVLKGIGEFMQVVSDMSHTTFHGFNPKLAELANRNRCIDYIAVDRAHAQSIQVPLAKTVEESTVSDHSPIYVTVADAGCANPLPLVQSHRGGRAEFADNAVGGFKRCLAANVRGYETDVRFSKDHELVIMHDNRVNRTTDGTGIVEQMTLSELKRCLIKPCNEPVPTLADLLAVFKDRDDIFIELEMKAGKNEFYTDAVLEEYCRKLSATARRMLRPGTFAFTSFNERTLATMRRVDPAAPLCLITSGAFDDAFLARAKRLNCMGVSPLLAKATKEMVDKAHAQGFAVALWMVQDVKTYRAAQEKGADRVTSDHPMKLVSDLSSK